MAQWEPQFWQSSIESGLSRRERRSGHYSTYLPDPLMGRHFPPSPELDAALHAAETAIRTLSDPALQRNMAGISRFLLRSEAIASSQIEGITPNARNVALAELADEQGENLRGITDQARLVARNMTTVKASIATLAEREIVTTADLEKAHQSLIDAPELHGIRTRQNWIGGSSYHPLDADFVPPSPEHVRSLMDDLCSYLSGATHSPVLQAALIHAQFETIHPFADGNGRLGRALIHSVFTRRGLTPSSMLPISLILATFSRQYIDTLNAYRYDADPTSPEAMSAQTQWVTFFCHAIERACEQSLQIHHDIEELLDEYRELIATYRHTHNMRALRSDSAAFMILNALPSAPVLTARSAAQIFSLSKVSAGRALTELADAGVLSASQTSSEQTVYSARALLDLVTVTERRLASTRFDTRVSAPNRPVATLPSS